MVYYIFHAAMSLFVNILNSQKPGEAQEDHRSIKMAAGFFSTLSPTSADCRHVLFMAKITTLLELLAREIIERNERKERNAEKAKGNKSVDSSAAAPFKNESYSTSDPPPEQLASHQRPDHHPVTVADIPNYSDHASYNYFPAGQGVSMPHNDHSGTIPGVPITTMSGPQNLTSTSLNGDNLLFHTGSQNEPALTATTGSQVVPEFWQVPLAADWEFVIPDQVPGGLYVPSDYYPLPQCSMVEGHGGLYGTVNNGGFVTNPTTQNPFVDGNMVWSNMFY